MPGLAPLKTQSSPGFRATDISPSDVRCTGGGGREPRTLGVLGNRSPLPGVPRFYCMWPYSIMHKHTGSGHAYFSDLEGRVVRNQLF